MILYYVRHGDPIYNPDSLTPLGERQAEAVAKRLALYGVDKVYSSTSTRAIQTSKPTCEITKKEPELLEWAKEHNAWVDLAVQKEDGKWDWCFFTPKFRELFCSKEIRDLGDNWFDHPECAKHPFKKGIERIYNESDAFLESLGYEHIRYTGKYKVKEQNDKRIAFFAHQGFGLAFLSCILDIPYPVFSTHYDFCHTGVTVIEFKEENGFCIPKVLTHSSDSHLYREGLPTFYNHQVRF